MCLRRVGDYQNIRISFDEMLNSKKIQLRRDIIISKWRGFRDIAIC